MKIAATSMAFSAQHSVTIRHESRETLHAWSGAARADAAGKPATHALSLPSISIAGFNAQAQGQSAAQSIGDALDQAGHDPILQLIRTMLELLTGQIIQVFSAAEMPAQPPPAVIAPPQLPLPSSQASDNAGFGAEYQRREVFTEIERTAFQASGTIRTGDGKEIQFQLELSMQRSFRAESNISLSAGAARQKDPLVINFGGSAAQLQNRRFLFDLAGNGQQENVPLLAAGSGFLALDLNRNGRIDSGKELFGAASGNGFADLAAHDGDGNGWIDENDPVFSQLQVWTPDGVGAGTLDSLQQKNVGGLFLGSQTSPFEIKDMNNQLLGSVRTSGIYLTENATAGTLQQIDLSI